jgi:Lrp/AsnC family leucine-responsive transcriptional regulator
MLDEIDINILKILQKEGRLPNSELAQRIFLSPSQCLRRLRHLEKTGVIKGYAALLNPQAIGLGVQAYVYVTLEKNGQDSADEFAEAIKNWEEILECWAVTGDEDYLMKRLLALAIVSGVRSNILLQELKDSTTLPLKQLK